MRAAFLYLLSFEANSLLKDQNKDGTSQEKLKRLPIFGQPFYYL